MKAILVFIDGTICDTRHRHHLMDAPEFYQRENMLEDLPVSGSAVCLQELTHNYILVYMGARPAFTLPTTKEWLGRAGFPKGSIYLAATHAERLFLLSGLRNEFDFIAGVGDCWEDNELHAELGCLSIILQEYCGDWDSVAERVITYHRQRKIRENEIHLRGKVEGLARLCPLLVSRFGVKLWDAYFAAVLEKAESSRIERAREDLEAFRKYGLNPKDLRDAAKLDGIAREEDWENNSAYGLQDFELVEATERRDVHKVTRCLYAELWREKGFPGIGYQIHCHTDMAWWDRPAWNPRVRFEQTKTLMQGDEYCLFVQYLPNG